MSSPATMDDFRAELRTIFSEATAEGQTGVEVLSADLHDKVMGVGTGINRMPMACAAMQQVRGPADTVIETSPSGQTSRLRIRYSLPRQADQESG